MEIKIIASVGENAKNRESDVRVVQKALNNIMQYNILAPLPPLAEDGIAGRKTKVAIRQFQRVAVGMTAPDGRIDPGGKTIVKLNAVINTATKLPNIKTPITNAWSPTYDLDLLLTGVYQQFNRIQYGVLAGEPVHKAQALNVGEHANKDLRALSKSEFVRQVFEEAKKEELTSKIPAAITTAQAILETGFGKAVPTDLYTKQYSYNLFGIKGIGPAGFVSVYTHEVIKNKRVKIIDKFQAYHSFAGSIKGRTEFLKNNRRYKTLFESTDPIEWAEGLQKARYATDPNYAKLLTSIMKSWKLI
jgi:peptidoglycan hydrolase-like protein with peptidoglycan-binding domain